MTQPTFKYKEFYDAQIEFLAQKDAEGLITTNYTEDAELLSFQNHIIGRSNLITYFTGYIANLGYIKPTNRRVDHVLKLSLQRPY